MATDEREVMIGFRVPASMKREIEELAKRDDLTLTQIARQALREYLARKKKAA